MAFGRRCGSSAAQAQPVYKWVMPNGKTHYGSQPPADKDDAAPMKLQTNGTTTGAVGPRWFRGGKGASAKGPAVQPDGTKKIPEGVEDMAEGLQKVARHGR